MEEKVRHYESMEEQIKEIKRFTQEAEQNY